MSKNQKLPFCFESKPVKLIQKNELQLFKVNLSHIINHIYTSNILSKILLITNETRAHRTGGEPFVTFLCIKSI